MCTFIIFLLSCVLINAQAPALIDVSKSNSQFSQSFFKAVRSTPGNLVASPLSAQLALAMTQLGAGGNTASVMSSALHLPQDRTTSNEGFKQLTSTLHNENSADTNLKIVNRMYIQQDFNISNVFVNTVRDTFDSEPQTVDFINPNTTNNINKWVEQVTHDKIKNLIPERLLESQDTKALLVNAIYFNGKWEKEFTTEREKPFYTAEGEKLDVLMMSCERKHKHAAFKSLLGTELVQIPFKSSNLSFVILLPPNRHLLPEVEQKMETEDLNILINSAQPKEINIIMPKFNMESTLDLQEPLTKMGMGEIFTKRANFTGIANNDKLYVSNVLQKTLMQVNEQGVEASSATFVSLVLESLTLSSERDFLVQYPFLFYIVHQTSQHEYVVLFNGRVTRP